MICFHAENNTLFIQECVTSVTKFFYEYKPLRDLSLIMRDIEALEQETEDLLGEIKEDF